MEENTKVDPQVVKDFNDGYLAQRHAPEKLKDLIKALPADNKGAERFQSILKGQMLAMKEATQEDLRQRLSANLTKGKDKDLEHD